MSVINVEYFGGIGRWCTSSLDTTGSDGLDELLREISTQSGNLCYRYKIGDGDWIFAPSLDWPKRFKAGALWFDWLDDAPADAYPIIDCLTMTTMHTIEYPFTKSLKDAQMTDQPAPPPPLPPNALVDIRITRSKQDGKLTLEINAKPLHDLLDNMGAKLVQSGGTYTDRPATSYPVISNDAKLSTDILLKREYPLQISLSSFFSRPPSVLKLKEMCESGHAAVRTILDHYRPVDIRYTIVRTLG